jgi:hypothetical protein
MSLNYSIYLFSNIYNCASRVYACGLCIYVCGHVCVKKRFFLGGGRGGWGRPDGLVIEVKCNLEFQFCITVLWNYIQKDI